MVDHHVSVAGESCGGSDPHYQVFVELKGVRNLTEEQRYKVRKHFVFSFTCFISVPVNMSLRTFLSVLCQFLENLFHNLFRLCGYDGK